MSNKSIQAPIMRYLNETPALHVRLNQQPFEESDSVPGAITHGRVYKVVDLMTGAVGYNCWTSDLPNGEPATLVRVEAYDSFHGYASEILPIQEALMLVQELNRKSNENIDTLHTLLVKRVRQRLVDGNTETIDGFTALQDMAEMLLDIEGRRERPALPGWSK